MLRNFCILLLAGGVLFTLAGPAAAQLQGPIYIVQPGDTLSSIAARFNISLDDLMSANGITNPNLLDAGQQLTIPGLEGVTGVLDTELINFGDSFRSLLRRTQVPASMLQQLNRLVSPSEFYVGASMIVPKQADQPELTARISPEQGESLLELAVQQNTGVWSLVGLNGLNGTWDALPGDVLYAQGAAASGQATGGLPSAFESAEIANLPFKQGSTAEIIVKPAGSVGTLGGMLVDNPLHFFALPDGRQVALQGIHAMLDPGIYPLRLDATLPDGSSQSFEQMVLINSGNYAKEALSVPSELIDPAVTEPENQQVLSIVSPATPVRFWDGAFGVPVSLPYCIKDWFGQRRSFNGSDYDYFHSGVDYGICSPDHPFDIYAAANGAVIFSGPLTVRGNATLIDHGWGIYSAYFHQEETYVTAGEHVQKGQLIGKIGKTGRVTGPHLHWEIWVSGVQVNPLDWLSSAYP
jgi:murein DD-endopeptidase MepM/ murein hydrolase activator NlpD